VTATRVALQPSTAATSQPTRSAQSGEAAALSSLVSSVWHVFQFSVCISVITTKVMVVH
jgi:hypothetical protein